MQESYAARFCLGSAKIANPGGTFNQYYLMPLAVNEE